MVTGNALEELDANPLQLIATDAAGGRIPDGIEIRLQKRFAESTHGELRHFTMLEQHRVVAHDRNCAMQLMRPIPQQKKLLARACPVLRFGETTLPERKRLVGAH